MWRKRETLPAVYTHSVCANPSGTAAAGLSVTHRCLIHAEYDYLSLSKDFLGPSLSYNINIHASFVF